MKDNTTFEEVYQRVIEETGCNTQNKLAAFFGIKQASVSSAISKKSIPCSWILVLFDNGINPNYIRYGQLPKFNLGSQCLNVIHAIKWSYAIARQ